MLMAPGRHSNLLPDEYLSPSSTLSTHLTKYVGVDSVTYFGPGRGPRATTARL